MYLYLCMLPGDHRSRDWFVLQNRYCRRISRELLYEELILIIVCFLLSIDETVSVVLFNVVTV